MKYQKVKGNQYDAGNQHRNCPEAFFDDKFFPAVIAFLYFSFHAHNVPVTIDGVTIGTIFQLRHISPLFCTETGFNGTVT